LRVALSFTGCYRRGGIERAVLECANYLAARGHETTLFVSDWDRGALDPGVVVRPVPIPKRGSLLRLLAFRRRSRRVMASQRPPPDVHSAFGVLCPYGGVLWVPSVHQEWLAISRRQRDWKGRLKQRLNPIHPVLVSMEKNYYGRRRYKTLIALTENVKADLVRLYDVPPEDVAVLPSGYWPAEFSFARMEDKRAGMRGKLGYAEGDRVVIFVANELERKGFGPLLRGIARLGDSRVRLLAVGRLNPKRYVAEIERLGMTDRVKFTGPMDDVTLAFAAADVFALPTQYEAWGLVILEALACGLPVLTSRLAGAAITVREGETGALLDDPHDVEEIAAKLKPILDGAITRSEAISESVLWYSWERILAEYEQILQKAAA